MKEVDIEKPHRATAKYQYFAAISGMCSWFHFNMYVEQLIEILKLVNSKYCDVWLWLWNGKYLRNKKRIIINRF